MENQSGQPQVTQTATLPVTPQTQKGKSSKTLLLVLLTVILIAGGVGRGYWYGHKSQKTVTSNSAGTVKPVTKAAVPMQTSQSVHFVDSIGYPLDLAAKYQFVTNLGVPSFMQAVRVTSTIQNQSNAFQMFGNGTTNNELGRWELGNPANTQDNGGGASEVSLLAISKDWLAATGTTDYTGFYNSISPLETPGQKQQYVAQLKTSTAACAKDPTKGFTTKDGNLDICYTYDYGKESYDPIITLSGYGDMQGQPVVFIGLVNIYDTSVGSGQTAQSKAVSDALAGNPPAQTVQAQKAIISALAQTTVTVGPNPLTN